MNRVKKMFASLFKGDREPQAPPTRPDCCDEKHVEARGNSIDDLARRTHDVSRRLHVLEWQTMPEFKDTSEAAKTRREMGESTDG